MYVSNVVLMAMVGCTTYAELLNLDERGARPRSTTNSLGQVIYLTAFSTEQSLSSSPSPTTVLQTLIPTVTVSSSVTSICSTCANAPPPACPGKCLPNGYQACELSSSSNDFNCICTKERRYVDEFFDLIAPCVGNGTGCTDAEWSDYMYMLQSTCDSLQKPITSLPSMIATWIKYTATGAATQQGSGTETPDPTATSSNSNAPSASSGSASQDTTSITPFVPPADVKTNTATKIGVGVGVAAIAVLTMAGAAFFLLRRRRREAQTKVIAMEGSAAPALPPADEKKAAYEHNATVMELDGDQRAEMWSPPVEQRGFMSELPGDEAFFGAGTKGGVRERTVSELEGGGGKSGRGY